MDFGKIEIKKKIKKMPTLNTHTYFSKKKKKLKNADAMPVLSLQNS